MEQCGIWGDATTVSLTTRMCEAAGVNREWGLVVDEGMPSGLAHFLRRQGCECGRKKLKLFPFVCRDLEQAGKGE